MMDDGEVDSPSSGVGLLDLHSDHYSHFLDDSSVIQNDWETLIGTQICSHKHICNPTTGPDNTHTHTCEHTHTHTIGSGDDEKSSKKRRPSGNKEAVRKYREKQKAVKVNLEVKNAELEKENQRIPELQKENVKLRRKLQEQGPRQDAVEHLLAENKSLRGLLSQLRRAIDTELEGLEDVTYQKLLFSPPKVDRGKYLPSGARCAAPVACFPARPVAHQHTAGSSEDHQHIEESLGWHAECELGEKAMTCYSPQEELEDADVGTDQCRRVDPETTTPSRNAGTSSLGLKQRPIVCSSKTPPAARRQSINSGQIPSAPAAADAYQQQHPGEVPCPVAGVPLPCFNSGPRPAASHPHEVGKPQQVERWQEDCDLVRGDAEMTADSNPLPSASLSPPEDVMQSSSTLASKETLETPALKKLRVEASSSVDLFSPGCFFDDDLTPGAAAAHWNHHLLPAAVSDRWLEECDIIDGVCQAHWVDAMQNPCFEAPDGAGHDSNRSAAAAALPPTIRNQ